MMDNKKIAREIAEGSIVLLKNEGGVLPLAKGTKAAFFGRTQTESMLSGNGSGAANVEKPQEIISECRKRGIEPVEELESFYRTKLAAQAAAKPAFDLAQLKHMVNSGLMYEFFGRYTPPAEELAVPEELIARASAETDTAVLIIGRSSGGEECDRHLMGDYYLTDEEKTLVAQVAAAFQKVVLVLNVNGLIDLSWTEEYPSIKSIVFIGIPGEEGPAALAEILSGGVTPSGKLAMSIARDYSDYPADFSWDKEHPAKILTYADYGLDAEANGSVGFDKSPVTVYREDIYLGYRYFDTFGKKPLYPFGFGMSYTSFETAVCAVKKERDGFRVAASVKNTGGAVGREVVQVYVSAEGTESPRAYQELKGFVKTRTLAPGESETAEIFVPWRELACYREDAAAYVIERGRYVLRVGTSSAGTSPAGCIKVERDITVERCENRLGLADCNKGKIDFLRPEESAHETEDCEVLFELSAEDVAEYKPAPRETVPGLERFSDEELAALCVGYGPGTPFAAFKDTADPNTIFDADGNPLTTNSHPTGFNGYVSPAIEGKGVRSVFYKDGPAGVGAVAWPSEMLMACSFDTELCRRFGDAVGAECEEMRVDVWLAPAVNLQRHPLGGRNFEYFSEDPFLAGKCAAAVARGAQENHPVLVCAKHFAVNEQETYRRGSSRLHYDAVNSILTERAARELYLRPFETLVREAGLMCIMTSFNRINGVFAGGNADLCRGILRDEWGFRGAVVTDWGDMDVVVDGADAVAAGNDIVMPGGPPVISQILKGLEEGRVTRAELCEAVSHLTNLLKCFGRYDG